MSARGKFVAAVLGVCVLLLSVVWLAELPPFAPSAEPVAETAALPLPSPAAGKRDAGEAATDPSEGALRDPPAQPGLKSTAPARPPAEVPPPPAPDRPPPTVRPQVVQPAAAPPGDDPGPVPLELKVSGKLVSKAIDTAVTWLRKKQARDGSWGYLIDLGAYAQYHRSEPVTQRAGPTALALYTLLRSGVPVKDPVVRKAFQYLQKHHASPATSMESAMLLLAVLATADTGKYSSRTRRPSKPRVHGIYRKWASKLVDHLVEKRSARGWRYNVTGRVEALHVGGPEDLVSTHLCALALFSAQRLGIKTRERVWDEILRYTLDQQEDATLHRPDPKVPRGFAYIHGHPVSDEGKATGGATACGIALLRMTTFILTDAGMRPERLDQRGAALHATVTASLPAAYAWLLEHWSPYANPGKKPGSKVLHHHWLWALETAQDLHHAPSDAIGKHTWYLEIARELVNRQHKDGHWHVLGTWAPADTLDTCFAILFLKRATRGLIPAR